MPDKTQETLKSPFAIPEPSPSEVLPAGSAATAFENATPDGYVPASNLGVHTTDTRDSALTSMEAFLDVDDLSTNPNTPKRTRVETGKVALGGEHVEF